MLGYKTFRGINDKHLYFSGIADNTMLSPLSLRVKFCIVVSALLAIATALITGTIILIYVQ